eukprot:10436295-Alexandrium_andersonii.AAC.1
MLGLVTRPCIRVRVAFLLSKKATRATDGNRDTRSSFSRNIRTRLSHLFISITLSSLKGSSNRHRRLRDRGLGKERSRCRLDPGSGPSRCPRARDLSTSSSGCPIST